MKSDFELILEECLAQMRAGKTMEECLSAHPTQKERLRPLLETAVHVWNIPVPRARAAAVQAGRERLLADANFQKISPIPVSSRRFPRYTDQVLGTLKTFLLGKTHPGMSLAFRLGVALVLVLLATGAFTVKASTSSLPGDRLYHVKRTWETLRLSLTSDQQRKQHLMEQFAVERLDEVKKMMHLRRGGTVEFQAPLEEMNGELWQVDGFLVQIDSDTEVDGEPETGAEVNVRARLEPDGALIAIQVRAPFGKQPTPELTTTPTPSLTPQSEGDSEAQGIETYPYQQAPGETPQPTEVKVDEEGNEEGNEETIQPTQPFEPKATHTPEFRTTRTPEPTEHRDTTHTPEPTESREATHTPKPTEAPEATHPPKPTEQHFETPEPTHEH